MNDLEAMAGALRASGQYRVQRRLQPRLRINDSHGAPTRLGLFVDVETTGLDPTKHEIIELGMIPFSYLSDGLICDIGPPFEQFQEPSSPIPPTITRLTGINDAMVAGQRIDVDAVRALVDRASLVIAHNASFDRRFLERLTVSTIHGVKGTEFEAVIAFGLLEGMVPHFNENDKIAAASKLLYVICSRAKKNLHLISEVGRRRWQNNVYQPTDILLACSFGYDQIP